jgi:hypothetical protein
MSEVEVLWRFDASTLWGMGAFMWDRTSNTGSFIMHAWTDDERERAMKDVRESTLIFEGMAAVRCASAFAPLSKARRVLMEGDNEGLAHGLRKCYNKSPEVMDLIHSVWSAASAAGVVLRTAHVLGEVFNVIADRLSHNLKREALQLAWDTLGVKLVRVPAH